jgi:hypothetical protein
MTEIEEFRKVARRAETGYVVFRYTDEPTGKQVYHQLKIPVEILEEMCNDDR